MHNVCWGEPEPEYSEIKFDLERGRFFGYSEAVIRKILD
jgi:hypothetical protein